MLFAAKPRLGLSSELSGQQTIYYAEKLVIGVPVIAEGQHQDAVLLRPMGIDNSIHKSQVLGHLTPSSSAAMRLRLYAVLRSFQLKSHNRNSTRPTKTGPVDIRCMVERTVGARDHIQCIRRSTSDAKYIQCISQFLKNMVLVPAEVNTFCMWDLNHHGTPICKSQSQDLAFILRKAGLASLALAKAMASIGRLDVTSLLSFYPSVDI